jgi:hypothetical protein
VQEWQIWLLLGGVVGLLAGLPLWLLRDRKSIKRDVRLHLFDGPTLGGVLVAYSHEHYVLQAPKIYEADDQTVKLDGHIEVAGNHVMFVQVVHEGLR